MWDFLYSAFDYILDCIFDIIDGIISFVNDIAGWFRNFNLVRGKDVPVVIDAQSEFGQQLAEKLEEAEVIDTGLDLFGDSFIEGSFNKETNAFEHARVVAGDDGVDYQTRANFKGKDIIALS